MIAFQEPCPRAERLLQVARKKGIATQEMRHMVTCLSESCPLRLSDFQINISIFMINEIILFLNFGLESFDILRQISNASCERKTRRREIAVQNAAKTLMIEPPVQFPG